MKGINMKLFLPAAMVAVFVIAACTPEQIRKTCAVGKAAQVLIDAGRGGEKEREVADGLRDYCAARGHSY
jgi:hypothetical protein